MSNRKLNPSSVATPSGAFSQAVSASGAGRTLYISGQLGVTADGVVADGFAEQAAQCWRNLVAILDADSMSVHDLVKVTTYLTDMTMSPQLGPVREGFLDGARPASTLVGISGLARPGCLIEVEAIAFKAD